MNTKLIGTAVGLALENREAIKNVSAPARNAATGAAQVVFRTFWKSTVVGTACLLVWFCTFVSTYILAGTNFVGTPEFMSFFALFMFIINPATICIIESRKMQKVVAAKNAAQREAARQEREQKEAEHAQALAAWTAYNEAQEAQQIQYAPTQPLVTIPPQPERQPQFH